MKTRRAKTRNGSRRSNRECRAIFAILSEYLDGALAARDCRELRQHLRDCSPCTEYLETLQKTVRICQRYSSVPAPPPSTKVHEAILRAFEKARSR
jgi:anti-sigma factor RsiW